MRGSGTIAGHAFPAGQGSTRRFHTSPRNVPAHQCRRALGASVTRTVAPVRVGGATAEVLDTHRPRADVLAVTRYRLLPAADRARRLHGDVKLITKWVVGDPDPGFTETRTIVG